MTDTFGDPLLVIIPLIIRDDTSRQQTELLVERFIRTETRTSTMNVTEQDTIFLCLLSPILVSRIVVTIAQPPS